MTRLDASFKGVHFYVESSSTSAGRRTVTHEYPQRDEPFTEDLGRSARRYTLEAFVLGYDFIDQAERLRDAIESPGVGTLVHPEFGELQVLAVGGATVAFSQSNRMARFSLEFVEAGLNAFPQSDSATQTLSRMSADSLVSSAIDSFSKAIRLNDVVDYVQSALDGDLLNMLDSIAGSEIAQVLGFADKVSDLANDAMSLVSTDPKVFAQKFMGAIGLSGMATTAAGWSRAVTRLNSLVGDLHGSEEPSYTSVKPESSLIVENNRAAVYALARQGIAAQMVGVTTLVGTRLDTTVKTSEIKTEDGEDVEHENASSTAPTVSYDEMMDVRDKVIATLEEEMLTVSEIDDEFDSIREPASSAGQSEQPQSSVQESASTDLYMVLREAATAVSKDLSERAQDRGQLFNYDSGAVMPACVIATELYGDATRAEEICVRNSVSNPGFCPNVVKVLNE